MVISFLSRGDKNVPKLIIMRVTQLCEYAKNQGLVHFKWVNCMPCKLYLNKAIIFEKKNGREAEDKSEGNVTLERSQSAVM